VQPKNLRPETSGVVRPARPHPVRLGPTTLSISLAEASAITFQFDHVTPSAGQGTGRDGGCARKFYKPRLVGWCGLLAPTPLKPIPQSH